MKTRLLFLVLLLGSAAVVYCTDPAVVSEPQTERDSVGPCIHTQIFPCIWSQSSCKWYYGTTTFECTAVPKGSSIGVSAFSPESDLYSMSVLGQTDYNLWLDDDPNYQCLNVDCTYQGTQPRRFSGVAPNFSNYWVLFQNFNSVQRANITTTISIQ